MSKPLFVAISDIHFNINNLELASTALRAALDKAYSLSVPLIIAGDLHDTKAIIRGEVANQLLDIFSKTPVQTYILVGNHDLLNEKGAENGLNYLKSENVSIISHPVCWPGYEVRFIPYQNTTQKFKDALSSIPKGSIVVCHQGVQGAFLGDYVQDKTSVDPGSLEGYTLISGHYHRNQTVGPLTYIGSPFTHTFGEANDGDKGFIVVNSDGTFTREILDIRRHVKIEVNIEDLDGVHPVRPIDLLWLKVTGPQSLLNKIDKVALGQRLLGHSNFKLDLVSLTNSTQSPQLGVIVKLTDTQVLDKLIDSMPETVEQIDHLKNLWRRLVS